MFFKSCLLKNRGFVYLTDEQMVDEDNLDLLKDSDIINQVYSLTSLLLSGKYKFG